jgi:hypothetical protein
MEVITHKNGGKSNRETSRLTGLNRETVSKYWEEYKRKLHELSLPGADIKELQDELTSKPVYKKRESKPRKYTDEIEMRLKEILKSESRKDTILGANHKQKMTNKQIHALLREEGHDIGIATIGKALAVIASAGGKFRWLRLYTNQKKGVFMDSHVRFFEYVGGTYLEVVYDNMKNVVKKFIGKNEKELNPDLVKMSMYYGFKINVTNCFSGNEKGTVEKAGAELLFNLISSRNDKGSIIVTTNLTFDRWAETFHDPTLTAATVDRLTHKGHILDISREVGGRFEETVTWIESRKKQQKTKK